jgi:hypothetical protein
VSLECFVMCSKKIGENVFLPIIHWNFTANYSLYFFLWDKLWTTCVVAQTTAVELHSMVKYWCLLWFRVSIQKCLKLIPCLRRSKHNHLAFNYNLWNTLKLITWQCYVLFCWWEKLLIFQPQNFSVKYAVSNWPFLN